MDNWKLLFTDGTELTEAQAGFWDNVPDKGIKQATFILLNGSKLVFEKFNSICIAKLGIAVVSGENMHTGYRITEIKGEHVSDFIISAQGFNRSVVKKDQLTIPESCFRRGA